MINNGREYLINNRNYSNQTNLDCLFFFGSTLFDSCRFMSVDCILSHIFCLQSAFSVRIPREKKVGPLLWECRNHQTFYPIRMFVLETPIHSEQCKLSTLLIRLLAQFIFSLWVFEFLFTFC